MLNVFLHNNIVRLVVICVSRVNFSSFFILLISFQEVDIVFKPSDFSCKGIGN